MDLLLKKRPNKKILPLILLAGLMALAFYFFGDKLTVSALQRNHEALQSWRADNGWIAIGVYILTYIVVVALSLPGALILTLTGGFLFGVFAGAFYSVSGATIGALIIFLIAKTSLGDALAEKMHNQAGPTFAKIEKGLRENQLSFLFLIRLMPVIPFFVANIAPAFLGVSPRLYLITTFFGIIPGSLVYSWVGAGLGDVFAKGEEVNLSIIWEWQILGPILALSALSLMPVALKTLRGKEVL